MWREKEAGGGSTEQAASSQAKHAIKLLRHGLARLPEVPGLPSSPLCVLHDGTMWSAPWQQKYRLPPLNCAPLSTGRSLGISLSGRLLGISLSGRSLGINLFGRSLGINLSGR